MIGWFLASAAESSSLQARFEVETRGIRALDIMKDRPFAASPATTLRQLVLDYMLPQDRVSIPVVDGTRLVGVVALSDLKDIPREAWDWQTAESVMVRNVVTVSPNDSLAEVMRRMAQSEFDLLPVTDGERLVGTINRHDVLTYLQIVTLLGSRRGSEDRPSRLTPHGFGHGQI